MAIELTAEGREAKREYKRSWAAEHRERMRDSEARYWNRKGAELAGKKEDNNGNR